MWDTYNKNLRLLLVEDAPFLRYAFGRLLRMHGYEVMEATDGREALECVGTFRPNLVLTDLSMPIMDGVEFIRRLRANPETATLPVIAITADTSGKSEQRARAAGADDFVTKPVDLPILLTRLRAIPV